MLKDVDDVRCVALLADFGVAHTRTPPTRRTSRCCRTDRSRWRRRFWCAWRTTSTPLLTSSSAQLWYEKLPSKVFQTLEAKLEKAATNYEVRSRRGVVARVTQRRRWQASLLLAAQLPQREGLLLAWLMDLLVQVSISASLNGSTVEALGVQVRTRAPSQRQASTRNVARCGPCSQLSPVLCDGNSIVYEKLCKIAAMILQDKVRAVRRCSVCVRC